MTLTSKPLAVILFVVMFGGIAFSSAMGWWATESTKVPVTFTEGEFAGQANPADIRGSYTFGDIAKSFGDVTLTPTTFVIDKDGRIVKRYVGEPDFAQLHALLDDALNA